MEYMESPELRRPLYLRGDIHAVCVWVFAAVSLAACALVVAVSATGLFDIAVTFPGAPDPEAALLFTAGAAVLFTTFLKPARMVGTSVEISDANLRVREWYGKAYEIEMNPKMTIDRQFNVIRVFGKAFATDIPIPGVYRLIDGRTEVFFNLVGRGDQDAVLEYLRRLTSRN